MFNLIDMIELQMKKNNIKTQRELLNKMNKLNDGINYKPEHLSELFNGRSTQINYLYALEKIFKLPENTLIKMADLTNIHKKLIKNGGK